MITLINRSNIDLELPKMSKALLRAEEKTPIGKFWSIEALYDNLVNGEVVAFQQVESGYYGVLQTTSSPLAKILSFFWSGKDIDNTTPADWEEVDAFLQHAAKQLGCSLILCEGRRGWKSILEPLGYSEDSVVFLKEVSHELPTV